MPLTLTDSITGTVARLVLEGDVDGSTAPSFRAAVDKLLKAEPPQAKPESLVLVVEKLKYMSSAGLRVLIFAKQQSPNLKIYVVKPQAPIVDTLKKTGFYDGVYVTVEEPA